MRVSDGRFEGANLDEALTASDPARFDAIAGSLGRLAAETGRQVFYLTSNPADVAAWQRLLADAGEKPAPVIDLAAVRELKAAAAPERTHVDLVHVRVLRHDNLRSIAAREDLDRNGGQRRNRHDRDAGAVRQALRNGRGNAHTDERSRSVAECNRVQTRGGQARLFQHRANHGDEQTRVLTRLFLMPLNDVVAVLQRDGTGQ